jgi:hypothetical protein
LSTETMFERYYNERKRPNNFRKWMSVVQRFLTCPPISPPYFQRESLASERERKLVDITRREDIIEITALVSIRQPYRRKYQHQQNTHNVRLFFYSECRCDFDWQTQILSVFVETKKN